MAKSATPTSPTDKPGEDQNTGSNAGAASITHSPESSAGAGATGNDDGGPEMQRPILVRSVAAKGRWRIGRHFTQEPILLDAAELDYDQNTLLAGDPELIIQVVD